jgi:hypothetical protein
MERGSVKGCTRVDPSLTFRYLARIKNIFAEKPLRSRQLKTITAKTQQRNI